MRREEIDNAIKKEKALFYNDVYKGAVPDNYMELFKKAIFALPVSFAQITSTKLKEIANKDIKTLSFVEVAKIGEIILAVPLDKIYDNIETGLDESAKVETLMFNLEKARQEFEERTDRKHQSMINLGGVNGGNAMQNSMKIIGKA